jgi:hypothetical protein
LDASLWPSKFTTNSENEVCFQNGYVLASLIVLAYNSCILKLQQTLTLQGIILVKKTIEAIESISSLIALSCVLNKWIMIIDSLLM